MFRRTGQNDDGVNGSGIIMNKQQSSFLPEDYVEQCAERRMIAIGIVLFLIIMIAVVAAFFVTNRQWAELRSRQQEINTSYASAAERIEELTALESQKSQIDQKAAITAALIEPVPRSILLAELINYMPDEVSLESFELKSERIKDRKPVLPAAGKGQVRSLSGSGKDGQKPTKAEQAAARQVTAPKFKVSISLVGLAPTDLQVSEYITNLNQTPMLSDIQLKYSQEMKMDDRLLREFRIEALLARGADVKTFEPLRESRINRNPMDSTLEIDRFDRAYRGVQLDEEGKQ